MRRSISRLLIGLFAAPLTLVSSAALAAPGPEACNNIDLAANGQCDFEVAGGCQADCTPLNFVAACDGQCDVAVDASCTGGCEATCETECNANPGTFDCDANCTATCEASCAASCSDSSCQAQCHASCDHRCSVQCSATPPTVDCKGRCAASCDASCKVQANVDCSVKCSVDLEGGCKVQCSEPRGALFCDGQYVDITGTVDDCIAYLESKGLGVTVATDCALTPNSSDCNVSVGCSAAPGIGTIDNKAGVGAIAGLMLGVGLVVSRRRRRA
ncbi:MAG: hypothetical protein QM820_49865 [Minicystis sp.]